MARTASSLAAVLLLCSSCVSWMASGGGPTAKCPPQESLAPLCSCVESYDGPMMVCSHVLNADDLVGPVQATAHRDMFALLIRNSSLLYLPDGLFRNTRFQKVRLLNTELLSLSDTDSAFGGLESTLTEFRATDAHYSAQWRWSQLAPLRRLQLVDVNWIEMGVVSEPFPELPLLTALGVIRAGIDLVVDRAFAALPALQIFDMNGNRLARLPRNALPRPADHLYVINLSNNEFETLSADLFESMPSLTDVDLSGNRFSVLDEKTFSWAVDTLHSLRLEGNEIRCDCRMSWVVGRRLPVDFDVRCSLPESLRDKSVRGLTHPDLWC